LSSVWQMRDAIDQIEGALMGLGDFVDLDMIYETAREDLVIAPKMTVGQMRRVCDALAKCTAIVNEPWHTYPDRHEPGQDWCSDVAWEILDVLPPGVLDGVQRAYVSGLIAGSLSKAACEGPIQSLGNPPKFKR
jgi:hypothetical protein